MNRFYFKTSAKTNVNVKEAFEELLKLDSRNNLVLMNDKSSSSSTVNKNSVNPVKNKKIPENNKDSSKRKCLLM